MSQSRKARMTGAYAESAAGRSAKLFKDLGQDASAPFMAFAQLPSSVESFRAGSALFDRWMAASREMNAFATMRFAKDMKVMGELGSCRSPADVSTVWMKAATETARDYAEAYATLLKIGVSGKATDKQGQ